MQRYFKPDLKKIEALRIKHGLTVDAFAEKAGIDRRTLASLMRKNGVVMSTMCSIAKLLHVSVDALLPGYVEPWRRERISRFRGIALSVVVPDEGHA